MKKRLTTKGVGALQRSGDYWDTLLPGFGLRVLPSGAKSWVVLIDGNRRAIGRYPVLDLSQARELARQKLAAVALGDDPFATAMTVRELARRWAKQANHSERWSVYVKRIIDTVIVPEVGHLDVAKTPLRTMRQALCGALEPAYQRGATFGDLTRKTISAIFSWAERTGKIDVSPARNLPSLKRVISRDRVLSAEELVNIYNAVLDEDRETAWAIWMILLTGQRGGEVRRMRWEEITGTWWEHSQMKTGKTQRIPLGPLAVAVLDRIGRRESGKVWTDLTFQGHTNHRLREKSGIENWRPHDLRRTCATILAERGTSQSVIDAILGHGASGTRAVYNRARYHTAMIAAIEDLHRYLQTAIDGGGEVVNFRRGESR